MLGATARLAAVAAALPLVWFAQLNANYALVPVACAAGSRIALQAVSVAALLATLALGAAVVRPRLPDGEGRRADPGWPSIRVAVAVEAVVFVVAVILLGLPAVLVDPCA